MKFSSFFLFAFFLFLFLFFAEATLANEAVRLDLLKPTDISGYAEGLKVGEGNLITLIVYVTNYVLGFLGIVSLTAIIYAGILYIVNFGNEDMTSKSKTIMIYVALGMMVILLSYAIVNALVGVTGGGKGGPGGVGPGRISPSDRPVRTLESLFDVTKQDYILPIIDTLKNMGDLCPSTPRGLLVDSSGCSQLDILADTDSDGLMNMLDTDDDNDGVSDEADPDSDGDKVCDSGQSDKNCTGNDLCPDTLSFLSFKTKRIEERKVQVDRVDKESYEKFIRGITINPVTKQEEKRTINLGCAEYERMSDLDGDSVPDLEDCDQDNDGQIDDKRVVIQTRTATAPSFSSCLQAVENELKTVYKPGNPSGKDLTDGSTFKGVILMNILRNDVDLDQDNDGIADTPGLALESRELLRRQLANNFESLRSFIRITCATLPQTDAVLDYCRPKIGKVLSKLNTLSSRLSVEEFGNFNKVYQEFLSIVKNFPRVEAVIEATKTSDFLPPDTGALKISFDATKTRDPYQQYCSAKDDNYFWFVNKNLDFSNGLSGAITKEPPSGKGVFYTHQFTAPGIYNVQLLVKSACKYTSVNPGATEKDDVDAAVAGLTALQINVFPPEAQLIVRVNTLAVPGNNEIELLAGAQKVEFDLSQSVTNRGDFANLSYDCDNSETNSFATKQDQWKFSCDYTDDQTRSNKIIKLTARDGKGEVKREITLKFSTVIAVLDIQPGLKGTKSTVFTFDGKRSASTQRVTNYQYSVARLSTDSSLPPFDPPTLPQKPTVTYQFPTVGEYEVKLEVALGGGANQTSQTSVRILIEEQNPVAALVISIPKTIEPTRALFDGFLSFHPDYPDPSVLSFIWEVDGIQLQKAVQASDRATNIYHQVEAGKDSKVYYDFQSVGKHQVTLRVQKGANQDTEIQPFEIKNLLGVDFTANPAAAQVGAYITFTPDPLSNSALSYLWNFGDGSEEVVAAKEAVTHQFSKQGIYEVQLTVEDGSENTNRLMKRLRIGMKQEPLASAKVFINTLEQNTSASTCAQVTRQDSVLFDASDSINANGTDSGLSYEWTIEDSDDIVRTKTFTRRFKELSKGGCLDITLKVIDTSINKENIASPISLEVINKKPEMTELRLYSSQAGNITPISVTVSLIGARDPDGRVVRYRFWYFEEGNEGKKIDQHIADLDRTTFVIGPNDIEGSKSTYYFVAEIEDDSGALVSSAEALGRSDPFVVINGPNVAPIAEFIVDRGTINAGELIHFTSTTKDPLGEFIPSAAYQWDFEGDSEFDRGILGQKVSYRYAKPGVYRPILKVTKNGLSSVSEMEIRVLAGTKNPEAAFIFIPSGASVRFIGNSVVDSSLANKDITLAWDFNTLVDSDGNGIPDDDADSAVLNPTYEYKGDKDIFVALKVTDSVGNSSRVIRKIPFVKREEDLGPFGLSKNLKLKLILRTNPVQDPLDGRIYLEPPSSDIIFNLSQSTGKIQEYRIDTNIFVDTDADSIPDNDIDNKTHKSWKDGSVFKASYREGAEKIRAKVSVIDSAGQEKVQVLDIVFRTPEEEKEREEAKTPEELLKIFENVPVVTFDLSTAFIEPQKEIIFDASRTKFPGEKIKEFRWDFDSDDLIDEISFESKIRHAYPKEGAFEARLEAVSEGGLQGEYSQTVFVRGGLLLPKAEFSYDLKDREVYLKNTSTFDPSFKEEEVKFEWIFTKLDLGLKLPWQTWETVSDLVIQERVFNQPPIRVTGSVELLPEKEGSGILSREVILGSDSLLIHFKEGITFAKSNADPYLGFLALTEKKDSSVKVQNEQTVGVFETTVPEVLALSDEASLIFTGVIFNAKLYQLDALGVPLFLSEGKVEDNLTKFVSKTFGRSYVITGTLESTDVKKGEILGISTLKEPIKVFPEAGLYEIRLKVKDPLGEISEAAELFTFDTDLNLVEPGKALEEEKSKEPFFPEPRIISDEEEGFSYWFLSLIIFLVAATFFVLVIVIRTIRKKGEELSTKESASEVIQPEVVTPTVKVEEAKKTPEKKEPEDKGPKPPEPKKEEPQKPEPPKPPTPPQPSGPIPDWLKG